MLNKFLGICSWLLQKLQIRAVTFGKKTLVDVASADALFDGDGVVARQRSITGWCVRVAGARTAALHDKARAAGYN